MSAPDLNLLVTLQALLLEGSVVGAARRLRLSPSAVSRALSRLRTATGDPLLVRAGRGLVPTPRALALRERIGALVADAESVLRPADEPDLKKVVRTFTLRTSDGFVENFGPRLLSRLGEEAPGLRLRFVRKQDKEPGPLRDGTVDLETGVVGPETGPEVRVQSLFRDRLVGVVHPGHRLCHSEITPSSYAACRHICVVRYGLEEGSVDEALKSLGLARMVVATVDGFAVALALARASDLIATVPERHTASLRHGLESFPLPFATPDFTVSMLWHPRLQRDPAHRWLRACVRDVCLEAVPGTITASPAGGQAAGRE